MTLALFKAPQEKIPGENLGSAAPFEQSPVESSTEEQNTRVSEISQPILSGTPSLTLSYPPLTWDASQITRLGMAPTIEKTFAAYPQEVQEDPNFIEGLTAFLITTTKQHFGVDKASMMSDLIALRQEIIQKYGQRVEKNNHSVLRRIVLVENLLKTGFAAGFFFDAMAARKLTQQKSLTEKLNSSFITL